MRYAFVLLAGILVGCSTPAPAPLPAPAQPPALASARDPGDNELSVRIDLRDPAYRTAYVRGQIETLVIGLYDPAGTPFGRENATPISAAGYVPDYLPVLETRLGVAATEYGRFLIRRFDNPQSGGVLVANFTRIPEGARYRLFILAVRRTAAGEPYPIGLAKVDPLVVSGKERDAQGVISREVSLTLDEDPKVGVTGTVNDAPGSPGVGN